MTLVYNDKVSYILEVCVCVRAQRGSEGEVERVRGAGGDVKRGRGWVLRGARRQNATYYVFYYDIILCEDKAEPRYSDVR